MMKTKNANEQKTSRSTWALENVAKNNDQRNSVEKEK